MSFAIGWYPLAEGASVKERPVAVSAFGQNLVIWRASENRVAGLIDRCPHRAVRLSGGSIANGNLVCPFHGLSFSTDGTCAFVPELKRSAPTIAARPITTVEQDGFVWVHYPLGSRAKTSPPSLGCDRMKLAVAQLTTAAHITRLIENQLDYAHLPFVHRDTIGRYSSNDRHFSFSAHERGISARFTETPSTQGYEYGAPSVFRLQISRHMASLVLFCPIDEGSTRVFLIAAHGLAPTLGLGGAIARGMLLFNRRIYREDQAVVESHAAGSSTTTGAHERLLPSDRVIARFRQQWEEQLFRPTMDQDDAIRPKAVGQ